MRSEISDSFISRNQLAKEIAQKVAGVFRRSRGSRQFAAMLAAFFFGCMAQQKSLRAIVWLMINSRVGSRGVKLEWECIEEVNNYICLGQNISLQETNQEGEIKRRMQHGWAAFNKLSNIP